MYFKQTIDCNSLLFLKHLTVSTKNRKLEDILIQNIGAARLEIGA